MLMQKSYEATTDDGYNAVSWKINDLTSQFCGWYVVRFYKDGFPITETTTPIRDEFDAIRLVDGWTTQR